MDSPGVAAFVRLLHSGHVLFLASDRRASVWPVSSSFCPQFPYRLATTSSERLCRRWRFSGHGLPRTLDHVVLLAASHGHGCPAIEQAGETCDRVDRGAALSYVITMAPCTIRAYAIFGEFVPGESNIGRILYHDTQALGELGFLRYRSSEEGSVLNLFRMWYLIEGPRSGLSYLVLARHATWLAPTAVALSCYRGQWMKRSIFLLIVLLFINLGSALVRASVRYIVPVVTCLLPFFTAVVVDIGSRALHRTS